MNNCFVSDRVRSTALASMDSFEFYLAATLYSNALHELHC